MRGAVVAGKNDDGIFVQATGFQRVPQASYVVVHLGKDVYKRQTYGYLCAPLRAISPGYCLPGLAGVAGMRTGLSFISAIMP